MRRLGLNRLVLRYGARVVFERAQRTFLEHGRLPAAIANDLWRGFRRDEVRAHLRRMCAGYQASLPRVTRLFADIDIDTMVVWADADPHFPLAQAEALVAALPSAQLRTLPGASHWFMWDRPDEVADTLLEFTA
ncbi:MAG: alpha/beta fold hydrolase [Acidimicrobiales bacterium]|nr:alpha/beta fold hydrolase [Acidimicrobiales bacterium]